MERTEHGLPHSETEITWALEGLYSTGAMIADAAMQMPPHPEEWGMGYPQWSGTWGYWGGQTHKWVGPTVNLTRFEIAARNLDSNERQIDLKKGEYKFTFFPSARDIEFNVWEQFTPEDDPSIPNFDESTQITITPREVRASAGTETSNVYPVAVPATDGKVTVGTSPIEILNLDGGDASHGINIASWQKAYLKPGRFPPELKADFPNDDPSSFRIRVKKFKVSDSADLKPTVKIATESPDAQYSDSLSEIEMFTDTAAPEYWTSHPQMLVSDQNDDVYSENGAGADESLADRTHRAKLGSKVKVEVTRAGSTTKKEVRVPAPSHHIKRVALHVVIMRNKPEANGGVFPTTRERVEADIRAVNERFAPAGVLFTIADWEWSDPPGGVDLALGVIADKVVGDFYETFLIGEYFGRRLPSEVFVIYINNFLKADKTLAALMGLTYPGMNFILMGSQADSLLVAHELGHNFAWGAAPGNGPDDHASTDYMENVMYHGMHPVSPSNVSLRKRFNAEQITRIRQDPRAR